VGENKLYNEDKHQPHIGELWVNMSITPNRFLGNKQRTLHRIYNWYHSVLTAR